MKIDPEQKIYSKEFIEAISRFLSKEEIHEEIKLDEKDKSAIRNDFTSLSENEAEQVFAEESDDELELEEEDSESSEDEVYDYDHEMSNIIIDEYLNGHSLTNMAMPSEAPTAGIDNISNSCYINVCLQIFAYLDVTYEEVINVKSNNRLFSKLQELLIEIRSANHSVHPLTFMRSIKSLFKDRCPYGDAHECLLAMLSFANNNTNGSISKYIGIPIIEEITYLDGNSEERLEEFIVLELICPPGEEISLDELIEDNLREKEKYDSNNNFYSKSNFRIEYKSMPTMILFIHLNRYEYDTVNNSVHKKNISIKFDKNLRFCDHNYDLACIVAHYGSVLSGHYVCYIFDKGCIWKYNDSLVQSIDNLEADQFKYAYLLVYKISFQRKIV